MDSKRSEKLLEGHDSRRLRRSLSPVRKVRVATDDDESLERSRKVGQYLQVSNYEVRLAREKSTESWVQCR
jgi:hypothetical protein